MYTSALSGNDVCHPRLGAASQQDRFPTDVVIDPRVQPGVGDQVDLAAEHSLDQLPEAKERERRGAVGSLDDQVDVGVLPCVSSGDGAEGRESRVAMLLRDRR